MATFGDVSSAVTPDIGFPPGHGGKVVGNISVSVKTQTSLLFNTQTGNCNCQTGPAPTLHLSREEKTLHFQIAGSLAIHIARRCTETLLS